VSVAPIEPVYYLALSRRIIAHPPRHPDTPPLASYNHLPLTTLSRSLRHAQFPTNAHHHRRHVWPVRDSQQRQWQEQEAVNGRAEA
jgi:hypothetical protein